jgi:hypothetical protein
VNDTNRTNERTERIEEERLTTADLAGAGQERPRNEEHNLQPSGTPVEVIRAPREEGRNFGGSDTPARSGAQSVPASRSASAATGTAAAMAKEPDSGPLFSQEEAGNLRARWDAIQVGFVDEPRRAVEEATVLWPSR